MTQESNSIAVENLEAQLRESFGRVVYTHKAHEKSADDVLFWFRVRRIIQTVLSAIASTGFLTILLGDPAKSHDSAIVGGIAALLLAFLNVYMQGNNPMQDVQRHTEVASKLWLVRERYVSLLNDVCSHTLSLEEGKIQRAVLQDTLAEIYKDAPRTTSRSYKQAQRGLQQNAELTFVDEAEIDAFLPPGLRKKKSGAEN